MKAFQNKRTEFHLDEIWMKFGEHQLQMGIRLTCVNLEKKKKKMEV